MAVGEVFDLSRPYMYYSLECGGSVVECQTRNRYCIYIYIFIINVNFRTCGRIRRANEKAGLYLNVGKTKVMTTGDIGEVTVDGMDIEVVTKFVFLGALITKDGLCEKEVRRRIAMGKAAMGGLTLIWKDRGVTLETKVRQFWCSRLFFTERRLGQ